jgi:2-methylcitrate dehydratase
LWAPKTRETADHSMLVAVVVTLLDGTITPDTFNSERFKHPEVLELIQRTKVDVLDEFTKQAPGVRNCRVSVTATDGSAHVSHIKWTTEDVERGLSDVEIEEKFDALNRDVMPSAERRALLDLLWKLDTLADVRTVINHLRI